MPQTNPAAPYPAAPAVPDKKPGGLVGIWIGVACIVGGIILGVVLVISGARSFIDGLNDLQRVPMSTGGTVDIEETGTQTIYAERESPNGSTSFNTSTYAGYQPPVTVEVTGPDGSPVMVQPISGSETYTIDGHAGIAIAKFTASTPGRYAIKPRAGDGASSYNTVAVGSAIEFSGVGAILGGVFGGGALVLLGIILLIVFAVKRSRGKKRIALAANPYGTGYGAAGGAAGWPAAPGYPQQPGYGQQPGYPQPGGYAPPPVPPGAAPGWVPPPAAPGNSGAPAGAPGWAAPPVVAGMAPPPPAPAPVGPPAPPPAAMAPTDPPPAPWQPPGAPTATPGASTTDAWSSAAEPPPFEPPDQPTFESPTPAPPAEGEAGEDQTP